MIQKNVQFAIQENIQKVYDEKLPLDLNDANFAGRKTLMDTTMK